MCHLTSLYSPPPMHPTANVHVKVKMFTTIEATLEATIEATKHTHTHTHTHISEISSHKVTSISSIYELKLR